MDEVKLPSSWDRISLDEISNFIDYRGRTPLKTTSGIPLITAKNIRNGFINPEPREYISEDDYDDWMTRGIPQFGDVVITTEAPMGNVAIIKIKEKFAMAQRAICLQFYEYEMSRFSHYALRSPEFQKLLTLNATGTTVSGIKAATLKKLKLPIPSLLEQKIIADKLDSLLAQVNSTKARLEKIPQTLKRFRQAVLAAAVSGKLTEEWRGTTILIDWKKGILKNFIKKPSYGTSAKSHKEGLIPVLRMGNLQSGKLDWSDLVYTSDKNEIEKYKLIAGDILFNRTNSPELVGKTSIYRGERDAIYAGYLIKVQCLDGLNPEYLNYHLNSHIAKQYCHEVKSDGVSQSNINAQKLAAYPLIVPSIEEQAEIVRRVEQLFVYADAIEKQVQNALDRVRNLTQSILAKAFRGELTAQWRVENPDLISGENSAQALLVQIQQQRSSIKTIKRGKGNS
ncbi:restriction endonuclease subunit S [Yersinia intermedia]|uniref:restriction endonuclease subunit S n=1 Tax=Yersinia intermedia TaxID=631 RepID=UPI0022FE22B4|nr:restriction endonuclease subunit S [Yersinia intermedia]MDA5510823.1 restriction endonuclease subunit S [Yersinia intermedia]